MADRPGKDPQRRRATGATASAWQRPAYPESVERLIVELTRMPGIGRRSAERLAFYLVKSEAEVSRRLAGAIEGARKAVRDCSVCHNLTETDPCAVCADGGRDRATVLVVEQPRDLVAIEQTGMYRGVYHVLMGRISPLEGIGPGDLTIDDLSARARDGARNMGVAVAEVVLGLGPTIEGDATSLHVASVLEGAGVRVTRLARGLPTGMPLDQTSKAVLADALRGRRGLEE